MNVFYSQLTLEFCNVIAEYHKHMQAPKDNVTLLSSEISTYPLTNSSIKRHSAKEQINQRLSSGTSHRPITVNFKVWLISKT